MWSGLDFCGRGGEEVLVCMLAWDEPALVCVVGAERQGDALLSRRSFGLKEGSGGSEEQREK